jgi:DNA-binding transcriptional regulator YhcF (GntR family)
MLEKLFGSKTRVRVLRLFLNNSDKYFYIRELARSLELHLNAVRRELENLEEIGILIAVDKPAPIEEAVVKGVKHAETTTNRKYYRLNPDFSFVDDLRALFIKAHMVMENTLAEKVARLGDIDLFLLSGVFVGLDDAEADILIVGSLPKQKVQRLIVKFEKEMSRSLNYALMSKSEFNYRRSVADKFLLGLLENKNLILINRFKEEK